MAESITQDVEVNQQSAGRMPTDVTESTLSNTTKSGDERESIVANGDTNQNIEDQSLEAATAKSDTDTSRADGSNADSKSIDARPVKKLVPAKPVSFAKYSVPKVVAANTGKAAVEKAPLTNVVSPVSQPVGRPRLVAKTTSSLTQQVKSFRAAAPDPMQVWNKNRVTPQPSTKNLTDEELKQQYGIHLTSRIQSDGDGKEAKWADIDDDEDDWAPETIEWGDGTKSTVNPTDTAPAEKTLVTPQISTPATDTSTPIVESKQLATFQPSIGPNATVLKLGARAEIQQAQKAATQPNGPHEKLSLPPSKTTPAPAPAKSPWAKLPPVEKVSPVEIVPHGQQFSGQNAGYINNASATGLSPAREISADDFNRSFRDPPSQQLFNATSGRYEAVPSDKRRGSRHDQGFRAPAVLQRPNQTDTRGPEPSPAFQTNRTSSDVYRRRASSIISGGSGNMARRMSVKMGESPTVAINDSAIDTSEPQTSPVQSSVNPNAYQVRSSDISAQPGQTDEEIEAQRVQQRRLMREQAELARKRRLEEEARQEAEKKERIRQKLLSLGPDPKAVKAEDSPAKPESTAAGPESTSEASAKPVFPPKPPQPAATGEPQQYGMMKVHPMDSVKRPGVQPLPRSHADAQPLPTPGEEISPEPPLINGNIDHNRPNEVNGLPDPIPRNSRAVSSAAPETRGGWGRSEHRSAANLWTAPHNKALGNGTFDHTLAGYAPQDLSSRASSTGQGWMNGRTPTVGQSPPLPHSGQQVPETRSQTLQTMTSPEPTPLAMNSEADSMLPVRPPAPIGPPHVYGQGVNGFSSTHQTPSSTAAAIAGWNNFHNVARAQDRAEMEQHQRDQAARREEEQRTGVRPQANYHFEETFKQVQIGQQPDQRLVTSVTQHHTGPPSIFGAVGSVPSIPSQGNRGSRFFKQQNRVHDAPSPQQRAVTISHVPVPHSPSPPPAEELSSTHPVYEQASTLPVIRLPPAKAVVKLPPAKPLTPVEPSPTQENKPVTPVQPAMPTKPMSWAEKVSMAPPTAPKVAPQRIVSQPIASTPSWQERFNGLFGSTQQRRPSELPTTHSSQTPPAALAVTSASKEPLDVMPASSASASASVSLPNNPSSKATGVLSIKLKSVEEEEDLFEDREAGSLPHLHFPADAPAITWPQPVESRIFPTPPSAQTSIVYVGHSENDDRPQKHQFVLIRVPGMDNATRKDLPLKQTDTSTSTRRHRPPIKRGRGGGRHNPRHTTHTTA